MRRRVLLKTGMADARVLTRRTVRDGIVVEGPDASSWLQGQLSQDVAGMVEGESRLTLVLSPQGKVESFCRVTLLGGDRWLLDVERGFGSALVERLARFKIRVKVTLDQVTVACEERAGGGFESLGSPEIVTGDGGDEGGEGERAPSEDEAFEAARILAGVPRLGRELTERTIPQEAGNELIDLTVSFTKGCYTGQELVARLDSRGSNVPRRIQLVRGEGTARAGDLLEVDGKEAGLLTSVAAVGPDWVGLGLVKRGALSDHVIDAVVVDQGGTRRRARISPPAPSGEGT